MKDFNIQEILSMIPHRYPFLLIDKVIDFVPNESIVAIKNVTMNEPFFQGHFPERPVMPGVIILEAMAQATGILACQSSGQAIGKDVLYYFAGIDNARFKKVVLPGDQLRLEATYINAKKNLWKFAATAKVDDNVVCSATIMGAYKEI